jgi:hypothetical protein
MKAFSIDYDNTTDGPLNDYFAVNDLGSRLALKNLGSTFYFLIIYAIVWILYFILKSIATKCLR